MRLETPAEVNHEILWSCSGCGRLAGEEECGLILCPCGVMTSIRAYKTGGYEFELPHVCDEAYRIVYDGATIKIFDLKEVQDA